jgi:hypothetical protein
VQVQGVLHVLTRNELARREHLDMLWEVGTPYF